MARLANSTPATPNLLRGWRQIASFLGEPVSVVQRWARDGMPVRRESRAVISSPEDLNAWMGKESGKPVHVATEGTDLSKELKRGLSFVRREKVEAGEASPRKGVRKSKRRVMPR